MCRDPTISVCNQAIVKHFQIKKTSDFLIKIKVFHALKKNLSSVESDIIFSNILAHLPKKNPVKYTFSLLLAEQKRLNLLRMATQK